jgi:uncharacterized caspase-like protein
MTQRSGTIVFLTAVSLALGCASWAPLSGSGTAQEADELLVVDCLLPGKVRRVGQQMTYLTARRPVKTSATDCGIRGGEYTSYDRASYATALKIWLEPAKQGDPQAQTYVGEIYEKGLGLMPDFEAAALWYGRAAEQDYAPAQINLGQLYELGRGVRRDPKQALAWYRRASGLSDLSLDFKASVASDTEKAQLREDLERREQEVQRLRDELDGLRRKQNQDGADSDAHAADLEIEITRLRQEAEQLRVQITANQQPADVDLPAPTIEMLDPKVPLTRGVKIVQTIAAEDKRAIVGHVDSPAGLMSLTINDASVDVTKKGIFRTDVIVGPDGTKVMIVATDRRGGRAERQFMLAPSPPAAPVDARAEPKIDFGNYYALVIGNNAYQNPGLARLKTAKADAKAIAGVLESRFGFRVTTLYDATRYDILSALNTLRAKLTERDNLLIFYAGHGELDRANSRGHWLPVDAEPDSTANWISNIALTDILNAMNARHIMVVADSCYSGSLTRSALARLEAGLTPEAREAWMRGMVGKKSRTALTSGGLAPVLDSGGGGHSIFAKALLNVLEETVEAIEGQRLFQLISARVAWAAEARAFEQLPQYAPIKYAGHESGDFFLVPQG